MIHDDVILEFFPDSNQRGRREATLYINSPDVEEIDQTDVLNRLMNNGINLERLHICKLKVSAELNVLCVCWHGPHNTGDTEEKKDLLKKLLKVLHSLMNDRSAGRSEPNCGPIGELRRRLDCEAFTLAGDFNLAYSAAEQVIRENEKIIGENNEAIDYMIIWPSDLFKFRWDTETYNEFNHKVVYIQLTFDRDLYEFGRMVEGIGNLWL